MALCPNVYRRGALYWWRRKFVVPSSQCYTIALSMRVRDPTTARILGARLNFEAGLLAQQIGDRMTTIEEGRRQLEATIEQTVWIAGDDLTEVRALPIRTPDLAFSQTYTQDQERAMLLAMARETEMRFEAEATFNHMRHGLDDLGQPYDVVAMAAASERAIGYIYKFVGARGRGACIDEADRDAMRADDLSEDFVGFVQREVGFYGRREAGTHWQLGPDRAYFEKALSDAAVIVTQAAVLRLRRAYLSLCAEILFDAKARYDRTRPAIPDVLTSLRQERARKIAVVSAGLSPDASSIASTRSSALPIPTIDDAATDHVRPETATVVEPPRLAVGAAPKSFIGMTEQLAVSKLRAKRAGRADGWTDKTAAQHVSIARLFVRVAGTDNPHLMAQAHVGAYRDLLDQLPKAWGKSEKDQHRTLPEILARCEDLDDDEIGLAGSTINRHCTQLGTLLETSHGRGATIGEITSGMRADDTPRARAAFTLEDRETLFSSPTWTGDEIVHDAQFFVPLIGNYEVMRLSEITGLLPSDVDVDNGIIHVRPNAIRGLKSKESERDLPIMPELDRVGFRNYVEAIKRSGHELLWPELRLRGSATSLSNLYYKHWLALLLAALPNAQAEKKSFHSWRKTGNTHMAAKVTDPLRCQILGHAYRDINGRHYTDTLPLADKAEALSLIPATTAAVKAAPLSLHPGLRR